MPTETIPESAVIEGYDFNAGRDLDALMAKMLTSGFQATALGQAVEEVNRMVRGAARCGGVTLCWCWCWCWCWTVLS